MGQSERDELQGKAAEAAMAALAAGDVKAAQTYNAALETMQAMDEKYPLSDE